MPRRVLPAAPLALALVLTAAFSARAAEDRAERVRKDRKDFQAQGRWIYNDLARGFEEAKKSGKPLLVVFRCIPCEACRLFDEEVASEDERVRDLLGRFVLVRIPQANGMDLSLFQFDYDLSFAAFFLNADRTIYGRFGTRTTQQDKEGELSLEAFREAMQAALDLHARFPEVRQALQVKTGPAPVHARPEDHPGLSGKYKSSIDYEGKVVQSCIHCHQIREAERTVLRSARKPIPDTVLFPWPLPDVLGLELDPRKRATVLRVEPDSAARRAGFEIGDEVLTLAGQPLVSIADVQWVLHRAGETDRLAARVRRAGKELDLALPLEKGWRGRSDVSWRATTWDLRRMGTGGLLLEDLSSEARGQAGLGEKDLALRVRHAGEYGEHATARKAGFKKGDVIIAVEGRTERLSESRLIALTVQEKMPGDRLSFTVLREGKRLELSFALR